MSKKKIRKPKSDFVYLNEGYEYPIVIIHSVFSIPEAKLTVKALLQAIKYLESRKG